jgi:hypothetical protein
MNIFISWSGERSKVVAEALHDWLPKVIQALQPWMSSSDIEKGARWGSDIAEQLENSQVGIICLTPENLNAPWILFEAGALSKTLELTYVCPLLLGLGPADVKGPLSQFQVTTADKDDVRRLLDTINQALRDDRLPEARLGQTFEKWWPDLEERLEAIPAATDVPPPRSDRDILEEVLGLSRQALQSGRGTDLPLLELAKDVASYMASTIGMQDDAAELQRMLKQFASSPAYAYANVANAQLYREIQKDLYRALLNFVSRNNRQQDSVVGGTSPNEASPDSDPAVE